VRLVQLSNPCLGDEELQALKAPIASGWLTQGPEVDAFEAEFASAHNSLHAVAVTSATTGLHLSLLCLGINPGDEVLVPSFTWVASANAVVYCGATPVLVDCEPETFNLDQEDLLRKITSRTRAIIVVHLFGLCVDIPSLKNSLPREIPIIEDAACAAGARFKDWSAGSMGDLGVFSFHPRKTITTGEGGMITTNSEELAVLARKLRSHGASSGTKENSPTNPSLHMPEFDMLGYNYRMTDIQAAIGRVQLSKLESFIEDRRLFADEYESRLSHLDELRLPQIHGAAFHSLQSYVVHVRGDGSRRDSLASFLHSQGISTRPGTHAVHTLGFFQKTLGYRNEDLPGASECAANSLAIPLHNCLNQDDVDYVCSAIESWSQN